MIYWIYDYHLALKNDIDNIKLIYLLKNYSFSYIQLRAKNLPYKQFFSWSKKLKKLIQSLSSVPIIINDEPQIAYDLNLYGVHLGKTDRDISEVKKKFSNLAIGYTCHNLEDIIFSCQHPKIDYLGLGTIFPSTTKPELKVKGIEFLKQVLDKITKPFFCIGGINSSNISLLWDLAINNIAVSSCLFNKDFKKQIQILTQSNKMN